MAQEQSWRSFGATSDLPSNQIRAIGQSSDGILWVGTLKGLRYFFGSRFYSVPIPNAICLNLGGKSTSPPSELLMPGGLSKAQINAILSAPDGSLWIATNVGLFRRNHDRSWDQNLEQAGLKTHNIKTLLLDSMGNVWAGGIGASSDGGTRGTQSLARWSGSNWAEVTKFDIALEVGALAEGDPGYIWVAEPSGMIYILREMNVVRTIPPEEVLPQQLTLTRGTLNSLLHGTDGDMWVATTRGLVQFRNLAPINVYTQQEGLGGDAVSTLLGDQDNGLWAGTKNGLTHLVAGKPQSTLTEADGLADDRVHALFRDYEGNLWVGTESGLSRLPLGSWVIESDKLLKSSFVDHILTGPDGAYVAIRNGIVHQSANGTWMRIDQGLIGQSINALSHDTSGHIWVGTDAGLLRLGGDRFVTDPTFPSSAKITAILGDKTGALWIGTDNGLIHVANGNTTTFSKGRGQLGQNRVSSLWETATGDVWAGTDNGGATRFRQGVWQIVNLDSTQGGLISNFVTTGLEDSAGNLWFGTDRGLSRRSSVEFGIQANWHTFTETKLAGSNVKALWEDKRHPGHIWVGTEAGLSLVVGDEVSNFSSRDGLSNRQVLALSQGEDGVLWIGTAAGLTYHNDVAQPPQLVLCDVEVVGKLPNQPSQCDDLPYNSQKAEFKYSGTDLVDLDDLKYKTVLQRYSDKNGLGKDSDLTSQTSRSIKLTAGTTYTFTVSAIDKHFNESPAQWRVCRVNPSTWWDDIRDSSYFPLIVIGTLVAFGASPIPLYRLWRRRQFYVYRDLQVILSKGTIPGKYHVQLNAGKEPLSLSSLWNRLRTRILIMRNLFAGKTIPTQTVTNYESSLDMALLKPQLDLLREENMTEVPLQYIGKMLFKALFSPEAEDYLVKSLGLGHTSIRLRLRFNTEKGDGDEKKIRDLAALPWEFLHGGEKIGFLSLKDVTIVREVLEESYQETLHPKMLEKALIAWSTPRENFLPKLNVQDVERQVSEIHKTLSSCTKQASQSKQASAQAEEPASDSIIMLPHATDKTLPQKIRTGIDIIHFVGHGDVKKLEIHTIRDGADHPISGVERAVIYLEDENGFSVSWGSEELAPELSTFEKGKDKVPTLIVLGACRTADQVTSTELARTENMRCLAEDLAGLGEVRAVIGMGYPLAMKSITDFSIQFYKTLVSNGQVDYAVAQGRKAIANNGVDWGIPRLYLRTPYGMVPDGVIFDLAQTRRNSWGILRATKKV